MNPKVEARKLLSECTPDVARIVRKLRKMVGKATPGSHELVSHGALGYSPNNSPFDRIIYIAPYTTHANLGFFFGASIQDPHKILEGNGSRMRHVKVRTLEEAKDPRLEALVRSAWDAAPESLF